MELESQNTEYKITWQDEYIKTLCAFANTKGGSLFVGVNDQRQVIGIENAVYLLENLPNKISQRIGVFPEVNLINENGKQIIEIKMDKYSNPISYNGKYYIRRGSTTQELTDKELNRFLLQRSNLTWEGQTEETATLDDIDEATINRFKSFAKKRVPDIERETTTTLLKKLHLVDSEGKLKRAAILLFGKDVRNFFISAYFKIGKFQDETTLVTDDVIEGNLLQQVEKVLEILRTKYIRLIVKEYKDWRRIEEFEYPEEALREAIINAIIHKDYSGSHIQMKVYEDKIVLWNPGKLLEGITLSELKKEHESVQRNELICEVFYRADFIEAWGRGTTMIVDLCRTAALPEPEFVESSGGIRTIFYKDFFNENFFIKQNLSERQIKAVKYLKQNHKITNEKYQEICFISKPTATRDLVDLVEKGICTKIGTTGKGTEYVLVEFPNGSNGS